MSATIAIICHITHVLDMIFVEVQKHRLGGRDFVVNSGQQLVQVGFMAGGAFFDQLVHLDGSFDLRNSPRDLLHPYTSASGFGAA